MSFAMHLNGKCVARMCIVVVPRLCIAPQKLNMTWNEMHAGGNVTQKKRQITVLFLRLPTNTLRKICNTVAVKFVHFVLEYTHTPRRFKCNSICLNELNCLPELNDIGCA